MAQVGVKTSGGLGPHRQVSVIGKCMEGNLKMGRLMMGEMDGKWCYMSEVKIIHEEVP
jgi:hypothetical protein